MAGKIARPEGEVNSLPSNPTNDVPQQTLSPIDKLKDEFSRLEASFESLKTEITGEKTTIERTRDETVKQIDEQVTRIHEEVTEIGENMKEKVKKTSVDKLLLDTNSALKDVRGVRDAMNGLEDSSIVGNDEERLGQLQQEVKRLNELRQEVEDSTKTLISDVGVVEFVAEEIDRDNLSKQVGIASIERGGLFEVSVGKGDIRELGKWYDSREIECGGLKWSVSVMNLRNDIVKIRPKMIKTSETSNRPVRVDYTIKLVNIKDKPSLMKPGKQNISSNSGYLYWNNCISLSKLSDREEGFIDRDNKFKIEVTLNKIIYRI